MRRAPRPAHLARRFGKRRLVLFEIFDGLRLLGVRGLGVQMSVFSVLSFAGGLALAGFLLVMGELAVKVSEGSQVIRVHGRIVGTTEALVISAGFLVIFAATNLFAAKISSAISTAALTASRRGLVEAFFATDWSIQSEERLGHLQQLLGVNCSAVAAMVLGIARGLQSLLMLVALLGIAIAVSPLAALAVIVVGLLLSVLVRPLTALTRATSAKLAASSRSLGTLVTEYSRLAREFRLFGVERQALHQLDESIGETAAVFRRTNVLAQASPIVYQIGALGFVLIAVAAVSGHVEGNLTSFSAVLLLVLRSLTSASSLQGFNQQIHAAKGFLDEVLVDLSRYRSGRLAVPAAGATPASFEIELRSVSHSYDGIASALHDVSFLLPAGASLGLIGRSGSGKTTLSQIVLGIREPTAGVCLIGGVAPAKIPRSGGVGVFAFVPQEPILMQGTLADNIAFFRDVSRSDIEEAARAAHIHEDVVEMPNGYDSLVGESGGSLSGGQRQRVAIARALVGKPRVLVLDEPTSALDPRSEALIRRTLAELRGKVTVVVISHRLATLDECQLLAVLRRGELVDFGPRERILAGGAFRSVARGEGARPTAWSADGGGDAIGA